jgi:two-component system, OmpR family, KDP operon response regulator KdpE
MRPRILYVDDHEDTRFLLKSLLEASGYDLTTAATAGEGLRLARAGGFDLFLFDYKFGDGTGRELCEGVREFDPVTPILFFSGSHPALQQEALSCGAQGFVLKPDFDALKGEITRSLGRAA